MSTIASSIIDEVQQLLNWKDLNLRDRALVALSRAVARWAAVRPWDALRTYEDFTSDGTKFLALPERVRVPIHFSDVDNSSRIRPGGQWHRTHPIYWNNEQATGRPYEWRLIETQPVISQPQTDTALRVEASVSEAMSIYITGLVRDTAASGTALELYPVREVYSVTGTGYSLTTNLFVEVFDIEKSVEDAVADVKIYTDVDAKLVARIFADERSPEYRLVEFLAKPNAGQAIRCEYFRKPRKIVSELDTIPSVVNREFLVWRVAGDMHWIRNEHEQAALAWRKADGLMAEHQISEETHGERSDPIMPDYRYKMMEGEDLYDGGGW